MKKWTVTISLLGLPLLFGCHELTIESTVRADGSGVRTMLLVVPEDPDGEPITLDEYRAFMNITDEVQLRADGKQIQTIGKWVYELEKKQEGDSERITHRFHREDRPGELEDWARQSGDVHIFASTEEKKYANVAFRNTIEMSTGVGPDRRTITYRERFYWTGLVEAIIDYQIDGFRAPLMRNYPRLEPESVGEIIGFTKAAFWSAADQGILTMGDTERDEAFGPLAYRVKAHAMRVVRRHHPDADDAFFEDFVRRVFFDRNETDDDFFDNHALGALLASGLGIVVKLNLPGSVVDSNAHKREGTTLVWRFTGEDALAGEVELYARAELLSGEGS